MENLLNVENIARAVSLLAPGFIILSLRASVQGGPRPEIKDSLLRYAAISAIYYAAVNPFFHWKGGLELPIELWRSLQYFVIPFLLGLVAAYEVQREWLFRLSRVLGLYLAHQIPTGWDAVFSRLRRGTFVLVTLSKGEQVAGLMGQRSFASSSREERDLLLEEVWTISAAGVWQQADPARAVLLCGGEIRHIEIFEENS